MKNYIFILVIITVALPIVEFFANFTLPCKPLYGEKSVTNVDFTPRNWDNSKFQEDKEAYLNRNFGCRSCLIRFHNEIEYRLWGKLNSKDGILGKDDYLFQRGYIEEYTGKDFLGELAIKKQITKLQSLKDSLAKRNIFLLVLIVPSKAHFYPEYLPEKYKNKAIQCNYDCIIRESQQKNIPIIDLNNYFISHKTQSDYPLFTKTGTHWSAYGAAFAMDTIFKRLEKETKVDLPAFSWHEKEISDTTRGDDNDLWNFANIITSFQNAPLAYPKLTFNNSIGQKKIKVLTIGDSFWWNIFYSGAYDHLFEKSEFWYYGDKIFPEKDGRNVSKCNIHREIEKHNVIIIECAAMNLFQFGFGFIEKANLSYTNPQKADVTSLLFKQKIQEVTNNIKNTPEWLHDLTLSAEKEHISLDSMIHRNAIYVIEQEFKQAD